MSAGIEIDVGDVSPGNDGFRKLLKIARDTWELNVWLTDSDIATLRIKRPGRWGERQALRLGTSAGAPVFWSMEDAALTCMIGNDEETWDIAITLPDTALAEILSGIQA